MSFSASVGEPNANCEAKIMAEDGTTEILERNKRGELWVRAQNIMKGYWRNPKATKETKTEDGWLKTGDIAYVDDEGKFHVVDRMKVCSSNIINRSKINQTLTDWPGIDQSQGQPSGSRRVGSTTPRTPSNCRCGCDRSCDVSYFRFHSQLFNYPIYYHSMLSFSSSSLLSAQLLITSTTKSATTTNDLAHTSSSNQATPPPPTRSSGSWTARSLPQSGSPVGLYSSRRSRRIHRGRSCVKRCGNRRRRS